MDYGNTKTTSMHGQLGSVCHSWLSPGKATQISHGEKPKWDITVVKKKKKKKEEGKKIWTVIDFEKVNHEVMD